MKRRFIAYLLIILCVITGIFEASDADNRVDNCINNVNQIETEIKNKNYKNAVRLCDKTIELFNNDITGIMYCYYKHDILEEIHTNLTNLKGYIEYKDEVDIRVTIFDTLNKLKTIKSREKVDLKNVL